MKAVAYARFSSDNQREESIDAQLRAIREYAHKQNITIIHEYIDEARSATTDDRPGFLRMIDDVVSERFLVNYCYVHKLDRFSRNRYDSALYKRQLSQKGVKVIAVAQPLDDSPESIILESMLEAMAEYYSKNLAREVMKGLRENAFAGKHTGGIPPLGYNVGPDKKLFINENEAEAIRLIFNLVLAGNGYGTILEELNLRGFKTKYGKPFGKNSIYEILRNEKYSGVYLFNRTVSAINGKRNNHLQKDGENMIRIPGIIPAIISPEEWRRVQLMLNNRKTITPRRRSEVIYILTGKTFCSECGGAMVGSNAIAGRNKTRYYFYTCNAKKRTQQCTNKDIRKEILESHVLNRIEAMFSSKNIEKLSDKLLNYYLEKNQNLFLEKEQINKNLKNRQERLAAIFEALETGSMAPKVAGPRANELSAEIETLEENLRELEFRNKIPLTREMIRDYLKKNQQVVKDRTNLLDCKRAVETFIDRIKISQNDIEIILKLEMISDNDGGGGPLQFKSTIFIKDYRHNQLNS